MENPTFSLLRCLLCCQDELDEFPDIDGHDITSGLYSIKNFLKKLFISKPIDEASVRIIPTSVPSHSNIQRSSYARSEVRENLETKLLFSVLNRPGISSQSPSTSRPAQSSTFNQSPIFPKPAVLNRPGISSQSPSTSRPAQSSIFNQSPIFPKPAVLKPPLISSFKAPQESASLNPSSEKHDQTYQNPKLYLSRVGSITLGKAADTMKVNEPSHIIPEHFRDLIKIDIPSGISSQSPSTSRPAQSSTSSYIFNQSPTTPKPAVLKPPSISSFKAPQESASLSPSSEKHDQTYQNLKPYLSRVGSKKQGKASYTMKVNDPLHIIPEHFRDLIKNDIPPDILKKPLSAFTYKDYFSALLYAEDYDSEKWSDYKLLNVPVVLRDAAVYLRRNDEKINKIFVAFNVDDVPERRPYLLSRDLAYARPSGSEVEPFQGIIYRVVKSNLVLVEFKDDFHSQHRPSCKYDISFSFNRVSLKRAHQALDSISDSLFENFLFPTTVTRSSKTSNATLTSNSNRIGNEIFSVVSKISSIKSSPPYLIAGPRCASETKTSAYLKEPSRTGLIILKAVILIYKTNPHCRILICSPSNSACDVLMRGLMKEIPESEMFRANAAFREREEVPEDILSSCLYEEECFSCPPVKKLSSFKVILSTFISSYRLHTEGLPVGHFTHIFMVDSSIAIEPEALVPLANFADKNTAVIVTGEIRSSPSWVRSKIAREKGLKKSYFERLRKCRPYHGLNPDFITELDSKQDAYYM